MGLFEKLKNVFIEEEIVEDDVPAEIEKKEEPKEIIEEHKNIEEEPKVSETSDMSLLDNSQKFKFPIIFEEDDFKEEKKKSRSINVLERENTKYEPEIKDARPQKKVFKPSPVISPVYGVLDKNYSKDDISSKDNLLSNYEDKVDIDYVIKKAYGTPNEISKREEKFSDKNEEDKVIDLFEEKEEVPLTNEENKEVEEEYRVNEINEKVKSIDDLLEDTNDDDFYSLVDSMYKDEESDEE